MQQLHTTHEKHLLRSPGYWRQIRTEILEKSCFYLSLDPLTPTYNKGNFDFLTSHIKENLDTLTSLIKENLDTLKLLVI
jgi:hypothetical protein